MKTIPLTWCASGCGMLVVLRDDHVKGIPGKRVKGKYFSNNPCSRGLAGHRNGENLQVVLRSSVSSSTLRFLYDHCRWFFVNLNLIEGDAIVGKFVAKMNDRSHA